MDVLRVHPMFRWLAVGALMASARQGAARHVEVSARIEFIAKGTVVAIKPEPRPEIPGMAQE